MPVPQDVKHMSTMTISFKKKTSDRTTSSSDLIKCDHKQTGTEVQFTNESTETDAIAHQSQQTSCDGLILYKDAKSGRDEKTSFRNAAVATDPICTKDKAASCELPLENSKILINTSTMTSQSQGRWITFANLVNVRCGDNNNIALRSTSTNTESLSTSDKCNQTISAKFSDKTFQAEIRPLSNNVSTNTSSVLKYNRSTDCSEIQPVLRHNSSNTIALKTSTVSTQYTINRSNIVDCMVNTDIIKMSDAQTSTDDLGLLKNIDAYVDKVRFFDNTICHGNVKFNYTPFALCLETIENMFSTVYLNNMVFVDKNIACKIAAV